MIHEANSKAAALMAEIYQRSGPNILVIGDIILDVYRTGKATRLSPEAPVPVLLNTETRYQLGGAASVAACAKRLGANVTLVGFIGDDANGRRLRHLLDREEIDTRTTECIGRDTTAKERICAEAGDAARHLVRIDTEDCCPLPPGPAENIRLFVANGVAARPDIILISDYGKGVCTPAAVALAIESSISTIVDPPRDGEWAPYFSASAMTPNRIEADGRGAAVIADEYNLDAVALKMDRDGCIVYSWDQLKVHFEDTIYQSVARRVVDVTGAGDQFLATFGIARAVGASWLDAAYLANVAAGLQVEQAGIIPITQDQLLDRIEELHYATVDPRQTPSGR